MFSKMRIPFRRIATGVFITFMGLMGLVITAAYTRTSGSTHQDMSTAHLVRQKAVKSPVEKADKVVADVKRGP